MNEWMKFNITYKTSPKQIQRANSFLLSSLSLLNWFAQYGHAKIQQQMNRESNMATNSQTIQCHEHTSCLSVCHVRGQREIPESSIKLRHGHLRHNSTHTLHHHPGTKRSSIGHSSSHIGWAHEQKHWHYTSWTNCLVFQAQTMLSSEALKEGVHHYSADNVSGFVMVWSVACVHVPATDTATHCLADSLVGLQRIPHCCTSFWEGRTCIHWGLIIGSLGLVI